MTLVPLGDLLKKTGSIYKLTILASKRAVQLNEGSAPLVKEKKFSKLASLALKEILEGKISFKESKTK